MDGQRFSRINRPLLLAVLSLVLMAIGSQAYAVSWTENWDAGYSSGALVHSPWIQQTSDGITNGGAGRNLTIWGGGYSYPNSVYYSAWDLGLVSRATGVSSTDTNLVAQITLVRYGQERSWFVLSPQANCNGTKWMNVPGSLVMDTDGYSGSVNLSSVNSAGVATTVTVTGYAPEEAWTLWRFMLPKASGAQLASLQRNTGSGWTSVATINVDGSFKADHIGFGSYWTSGVDDVSFSSDAATVTPNLSIADAKQAVEGSAVQITSGVVCAAFDDFFYIEAYNRACGIRVQSPGHSLTANQTVASIVGSVRTISDTGERYIQATSVSGSGVYAMDPLGSSNQGLAGGGLPTTGLLVRSSGKATSVGNGIYKLDDGSGLDMRFQIASGSFTVDPDKTYVVTGPMSLYRDPSTSNLTKLILVKSAASRNYIRTVGESTWQIGDPIIWYWMGPVVNNVANDFTVGQLATGGWTMAWDIGWPATRQPKYLNLYHNHGIRVSLSLMDFVALWEPNPNFNFDDPAQTALFDLMINGLRNNPALYAYFLWDEPATSRFAFFGKFVAHLRKLDPTRPTIINLLPMEVPEGGLGTMGDKVTAYREYVRQYVETVRPDILSYDYYPFHVSGDIETYFINMMMVSEAAADAGIPFMNITQADADTPTWRWPTEHEERWETYTTLAYGGQGICWYQYNNAGGMSGFYEDSPASNVPRPQYTAICRTNRDFVAIGTELQPLKSLAVYHAGPHAKLGGSRDPRWITTLSESTGWGRTRSFPWGGLELPISCPFQVQSLSGTPNTLLGCFSKTGGITHVLVVNLDYANPLTTTLTGPGPMDLFDPVTRTWTQKTSSVDMNLPAGGGALVRLH